MQSRFQFRHVNEWVGFFVLGVVALVVTGIVVSSHSQRWFGRKFTLDVLLPKAGTSGLRRGDEVFILGVSAGLVHDVIVQEDGRVKAQVKVRRDFERFVRADSTASIKKAFAVAGDSFMEISAGTGAPLTGNHPTVICLAAEDSLGRMEKIVSDMQAELIPLVRKAADGVAEWTALGADLKTARAEISALFTRWDRLTEAVEQGKGTVGRLLTDSELADDAHALLERANLAMVQFQAIATNLHAASTNIQTGAARVPEIADGLASEMKDLPGLVHQTQSSMVELERLINALQRHWLVRKHVDPAHPRSLRTVTETPEVVEKPGRVLRSPRGADR
ncbi:MAG TPA: MlaD family protein [Verrucomicrobiae bacterium]|nr:MlaD family protein [Verrucomicrobiae bacterium]